SSRNLSSAALPISAVAKTLTFLSGIEKILPSFERRFQGFGRSGEIKRKPTHQSRIATSWTRFMPMSLLVVLTTIFFLTRKHGVLLCD
ncbi:MAG TPA: hypothetical protein VGL29_08805, partial [Blastocatellia bacterium]